MSATVKDGLKLDARLMQSIDERMNALTRKGVTVSEAPSGEVNISGCAKGYCQAWD